MRDEGHAVGLHCDEHLRHRSRDRAWCERDTDLALTRLRALASTPGDMAHAVGGAGAVD